MKLNLVGIIVSTLALPTWLIAQDSFSVLEKRKVQESSFTQEIKRYNDFSISLGAGIPLMQSADLKSIDDGNGKNLFGYSAYVSVDRAVTHAFGLSLQYDRGETRQGDFNTKDNGNGYAGRTQYDAISLLGDINFSNLLRRVDNHSPYRWALHGYVGVGVLSYRAYGKENGIQELKTQVKPFSFNSLLFQTGSGLKFKVSRKLDIEGRVMYVVTGDDRFDGGGDQYSAQNVREDQVSDNFFNATLGITLKLGKYISHLMWTDPLQQVYYKLDNIANMTPEVEVCKKGDLDNDGVCDDWDRQLDTPLGARVDGVGVALDTDLDGVIDLNDKCVTVAGPVENEGCPVVETAVSVPASDKTLEDYASDASLELKDVLFDFGKATIRSVSKEKLDLASKVIKASKGGKFLIIGHTDKKGNDNYNLKLSKDRAHAVVKALEKRGVSNGQLKSMGVGEAEAKVSEKASNAARLQDRRVEIKPAH